MFDLDPTVLFFSILYSFVGIGYYSYGKKHSPYFRWAGVGLFLFPYFVDTLWPLIGVGLVIILAPFILEKWFPL